MEFADYSDWLAENAGSVIRFRVATELLREKKVESAKRDLLSSNLVRYWLGNLRPDCGRNELHGAKTETYENVMGKLYEFGLRKGMPILDHKTGPFLRWLHQQISVPAEGYLPVFFRTLVSAFLTMTGYADDESVKAWVLRRLETIYPFARKGDLKEVYVPQDKFPGFPKAFKNAPLVNPEIYPHEEMKLPWIHDINAFLHSPSIMEDATLRAKVETRAREIHPDFRLPEASSWIWSRPPWAGTILHDGVERPLAWILWVRVFRHGVWKTASVARSLWQIKCGKRPHLVQSICGNVDSIQERRGSDQFSSRIFVREKNRNLGAGNENGAGGKSENQESHYLRIYIQISRDQVSQYLNDNQARHNLSRCYPRLLVGKVGSEPVSGGEISRALSDCNTLHEHIERDVFGKLFLLIV
jgi:hypothetical protein